MERAVYFRYVFIVFRGAADSIAKRVHSCNELRLRCIRAARRPSSPRPVGLVGDSTASCHTLSGRLRLHQPPSSVVKPAVFQTNDGQRFVQQTG